MYIRIKNWRLTVLALILISLFISLGVWQLERAAEKKKLIKNYHKQSNEAPLPGYQLLLNASQDWRFYRVTLEGRFDHQYTLLLDNKTFQGKIGYEVYTLFHAKDLPFPVLVDRGFVPIGTTRKKLPLIPHIIGQISITGMLNLPPRYQAFSQMAESPFTWPLRVQYLNIQELTELLHLPKIFPYVLQLDPKNPVAFPLEWQIIIMPPEKHYAYALQWFAIAFTLLVLWVALNWR